MSADARLERRRRQVLVLIALGLAGFWLAVIAIVIAAVGEDDTTELGSTSFPTVTRCSVVMPEDLDR